MQINKEKGKPFNKRSGEHQTTQATNTSLYSMFHNGVRDKIIKAAYVSKNYPDFINGNTLCLHYHLQGKYYRGEACTYSTSHTYYLNQKYRPFLQWARKLLNPSNQESKEDFESNQSLPLPPFPTSISIPPSSNLDSSKQDTKIKPESKASS